MDNLINKFKKIQQHLSELAIQFATNNDLYNKFASMIIDGYDFDLDLKYELINNMEMILLNANRFKKIIEITSERSLDHSSILAETGHNITYTNDKIIKILNNDIYPNDQIGIKLKKSHDALFNYVQIHMLSNTNDVLIDIPNDDILIESNPDSESEPDTNTDTETNHIYLNNELDIDFDEYLRPNQLKAIDKMVEQNFLSGVNCQIMGAGKSLIILKIIQIHHDLKSLQNNPKLYIICTERIDILRKLFLEPVYDKSKPVPKIVSYKQNQSNKDSWKLNNIIDLDKFEFIEYLTKKKFDSNKLVPKTKPILLVINNAFLKAQNSYKKIKRSHIGLVLVDECHLISGSINYQMFKWFKYGDDKSKDDITKSNIIKTNPNSNLICPIIGFSATPLRDTKKSANQLSDIFSDGIISSPTNKLNLISNYTLIDGLTDQIVLPFKHIIIENRSDGQLSQTRNVSEDLIKQIFTKYILNNEELPYKKGVCWDRLLKNISKNKATIKGITGNTYAGTLVTEELIPDERYNNHSSVITSNTSERYNNHSSVLAEIANNNYQIYEHHSKTESDLGFEQFCESESDAILLCVNCCKEGSDIKNLDYGLYLDGVKKRSFVVSMQTAGRIMRPDLLGKKTYAYIIEVLHSSTDSDGMSIEAMTVAKLLNYYNSILNLSADIDSNLASDSLIDSETNLSYDEISKDFFALYNSTYIIEDKNEIHIHIGHNIKPCIIKFDTKTIDWSKLKEYLDKKIKSICKLDATDQLNLILKVLKDLEIFKSDANYDIEYGKLDHNSLGLPNLIELKNRYRKIFDTKTWYEILGLKFDYSTLDEARIFFQDNKCKKIDEKTYNKLRRKNNRLPKYPLEYYKKSNISKYDDLILNVDYMLI